MKQDENMMSCTRLYVEYIETLVVQARKRRLLSFIIELSENMRGQDSFLIIITSYDNKHAF